MRSDPIGLEGGLNTFGYVGGSPVHYNDPMGLRIPAHDSGGISGANLVNTAGATISSALGVVNKAINKACDKNECPPCSPYHVGTVGYMSPKTSVRGLHGTRTGAGEDRYILYRVGQKNKNEGCECYWQEDKKIAGHHYMFQPNIFLTVNLNHKPRNKFLSYL